MRSMVGGLREQAITGPAETVRRFRPLHRLAAVPLPRDAGEDESSRGLHGSIRDHGSVPALRLLGEAAFQSVGKECQPH
jgi:hypothetical protein